MARLLVVDDDPNVARTLVELLGAHGYPADNAASGEEGLDRLQRLAYDLVVLDVRLPGINGFETCERIRERFGSALPVLMLTALGDTASLRQGYEAGADDFLQKPVDVPALILKVRAFLRIKSLHDETAQAREEAQARARDLAVLHEIGRDWSLIAEPEEFNRIVGQRLASLIGAPICGIALYDPSTRLMAAATPIHGVSDEVALRVRYEVKPEYRTLWNFRVGRAYMSNQARSDPRLLQEVVQALGAESVVLVPMLSEGSVLGLIMAANKPGGFSESDVQLLSIFAGPAATFLRSRLIFRRQREHATRTERLAILAGDMGAGVGRGPLLELVTSRVVEDLGYDRVAFYTAEGEGLRMEAEARSRWPGAQSAPDRELLSWALRGTTPLRTLSELGSELAVPVRAGDRCLGVLEVLRSLSTPFAEEEVSLLSTLAGQLALALEKSESQAETERLVWQMATLYDVGLQTAALTDLRVLFTKAAEEAGRLIAADHTSVLRYEEHERILQVFAGWARHPGNDDYTAPSFTMDEGVAGRVARDRVPALVNEPESDPDFVPKENPLARLLCVPLTYYDQERGQPVLFGVLNATRRRGGPPFTHDDLEYLMRFAGQLSIAVANSMAFEAERQRSEQLTLVNRLIREIAGSLSRERIMETAVRRIHEAFLYPVVGIGVPDVEAGLHRVVAAVGPGSRPEGWGDIPLHGGISGRALRERATVLVQDVSADPDYITLFPATRSQLSIPIFVGDEVRATLTVESEQRFAFDRGQVITLETLADGIGIILRNAELYHALERTGANLVELDRMKSELLNIVAHDFRAPLAGILGHAELLEWRPDAPVAARVEQARAIIESATHMANLVDKTLKTNRLETGHFPFEFGLADLSAVVRQVLARLPEDARHPIRLVLPEEPVPCWADRDRVAEVLENFVSNAVKYSPDGGEVEVRLQRQDEAAVVSVTDHGIGIAAADVERLFRPFSRLRHHRTANIQGSGLGLYICERIVRAHDGRLWVESRPEAGSTFSFSLPIYGQAAQTRPPVVLVASNDRWIRRDVRRVIEEQGLGVHEVGDGVEAVEAALRLLPVAVVLDRVLPRLGPEQVAARLKESTSTAAVPLLVLADPESLGDQAALFTACLPKPLDPDTLAAALSTHARSLTRADGQR